MNASRNTWTDADEEEFVRLLGEVRAENALISSAHETEEDSIKARLLERMLIRRRATAPGRPLHLPPLDVPHNDEVGPNLVLLDEKMRQYREAIYEIDWLAMGVDDVRQTRQLYPDKCNEVLGEIFNMTGCLTTAFVTAHNPFGRRLSDEENAARHLLLVAELDRMGFRSMGGRGSDPTGNWPSEESLLIIGLSREAAIRLGNQFDQDAILFSDDDFVPRLVVLR